MIFFKVRNGKVVNFLKVFMFTLRLQKTLLVLYLKLQNVVNVRTM